jgi:RNA polymerase sigma-70 factor (ECF subfamily)
MRNLFIDAYRRRRATPELIVIEGGRETEEGALSARVASLEEEVFQRLSEEEIRRALALLPEELRTALMLCDIEGFTYPEIAEIMECPLGTVRSRIARARQKLLIKLREHAETRRLVQK